MPHYPYLIIGGGMAADAAVRGIRDADPDGDIGLISAEPHPPYNRPPLSKGLWNGQPLEDIWRDTAELGATLHLGRRARALDAQTKQVVDDQGVSYGFDKLLLATGGRPRRLPGKDNAIIYFRTLDDYRRLRELAGQKRRFAIIGGGFIGSELAAALSGSGAEVTMLFPEAGIGRRTFPADLSTFLNHYYEDRGVRVLAGETVARVTPRNEETLLATQSGVELTVDAVVAGLGLEPNVELAREAGLEVANGIVTDEFLRAGQADVFAAGDAVNFYSPALGKHMRVEHEDNANSMGLVAGRNMAGQLAPYHHLPFFYSDLFDLGYEAVGELDASSETVSDWQEPYRKGVVYYLTGARVRGVLLWDTWGKLEAARQLIAEAGPFGPEALKGRLAG